MKLNKISLNTGLEGKNNEFIIDIIHIGKHLHAFYAGHLAYDTNDWNDRKMIMTAIVSTLKL